MLFSGLKGVGLNPNYTVIGMVRNWGSKPHGSVIGNILNKIDTNMAQIHRMGKTIRIAKLVNPRLYVKNIQ